MHNTFAGLTEKFSLNIFSTSKTKRLADQALDKTGKWHQRECPLKAPFILWFAVIMAVYRYKSIADI